MTSKYEVIEIDQCEITVDVSLLLKSDGLFFNATDMAKPFNKRPNDFLNTSENGNYIDALITLYGGNKDTYVYTKAGKKYGGTWLHKHLALQFARWLSPILAVKLDKWTFERIEREHDWQRKRLESKTGFLPLTNAIQNAHEPVHHHHFSNECNLINRIVLGVDAKAFKKKHDVDNVRDALDALQISQISQLQIINTGLIAIGMVYNDRKQQLTAFHERGLSCNVLPEAA